MDIAVCLKPLIFFIFFEVIYCLKFGPHSSEARFWQLMSVATTTRPAAVQSYRPVQHDGSVRFRPFVLEQEMTDLAWTDFGRFLIFEFVVIL